MSEELPQRPVIVGAGLIGTSIGLALGRRGIVAHLSDVDRGNAECAASMGAGQLSAPPAQPDLVVVAVPPDYLGAMISNAVERWPAATVTDVGSVKVSPLRAAAAAGCDLARYVGSHPIAGNEGSGPTAASAALFDGRPWAVVPHDRSAPAGIEAVEALVRACRARAVRVTADEHDAAVARTSHLPYLMAVLTAAGLENASADLSLVGPGLRDTTRVAASDPGLWSQILLHNAQPVTARLHEVRSAIDELLGVLAEAATTDTSATTGPEERRNGPASTALRELLRRGVEGTTAIRAAGGAAS